MSETRRYPPDAAARLHEALLAVVKAARVVVNGDPERTHESLHVALEQLDETRDEVMEEARR